MHLPTRTRSEESNPQADNPNNKCVGHIREDGDEDKPREKGEMKRAAMEAAMLSKRDNDVRRPFTKSNLHWLEIRHAPPPGNTSHNQEGGRGLPASSLVNIDVFRAPFVNTASVHEEP